MNKSILSSIPRPVTHLALDRTAVLTDALRKVEYDRHNKRLRFAQGQPEAVDCLIVGKEHYAEENRTFPLQSRKELNKILKLESDNFDGIMVYHIGHYIDGQRIVICWQMSSEVFSGLGLTPIFVIPESALLLSDNPNQLLSVSRNNRTFWFIDRQGQYLSAEKKGLISSSTMFLASAGLSDNTNNVEVDESDYLTRLGGSFLPALLTNLGGFKTSLRKLESIDWASHLKYSGVATVLLFGGYFALTSLYLNMRLNSAKEAQVVYADQTKDVFQLKAQLGVVEEKAGQINTVNNAVSAPNVVWRFIVPLAKRGIKFSRVSMSPDGTYSVVGEADKATDVLEFIKSDPLVVEPQFSGQNIVVNGKDRFSIAFRIKQGA
ncbi:MAG: hypothetical protein HRT35_02455 [Algicola sp.]|nr:hypothetical protein [Algicola sp.]